MDKQDERLLTQGERKAINDAMPPEAKYGDVFEAIAKAQLIKADKHNPTKYDVLEEIWTELCLVEKTREAPRSRQDFHLILEAARINLCKEWEGNKIQVKHRLDRPDKEKIIKKILENLYWRGRRHASTPISSFDVEPEADQILALYPDVEEIRKQERERIFPDGYYPAHLLAWADQLEREYGYHRANIVVFLRDLANRWQALKEV